MKVQDLLNSPERWTKSAIARDCNGNVVPALDSKAACYCLMGAIYKCYPPYSTQRREVYQKTARKLGNVSQWNDAPERTFKDIQNLIRKLDI